MQKIAPSVRSLQRAKVMWEQSNDDLRTARDLQNSNPELSCLQSVQAAINALSSLLEAQGFFPTAFVFCSGITGSLCSAEC